MSKSVFARVVLTAGLVATIASGLQADPMTSSTLGWIVDGTVSEATRAGDVVYLGGSIRTAAPAAKRVYGAVAMHTGSAEALFPALRFDDQVNVVIPDGVGGWFVGGKFSNIGDVDRDRLVRLTATGEIDLTWNVRVGQGQSSSVDALALAGGVLYVGGDFSNVNLQSRQRLAAINVATATLTGWDPGASGHVTSLAIDGDTVYVGGTFDTLGSQPRSRLGSVSAATGAATSWDPQASGEVNDFLIDGSTLYVAGAFTIIDGANREHLAGFALPAGTLLTEPSVAIDDEVHALAKNGATLYLGGAFHMVDGSNRDGLAAINATTGALLPWNPDADDCVYDIAFAGGLVYFVGAFDNVGANNERLYAAAVDAVSGAVAGWNPAFNGAARRLFIDGTIVHVLGDFWAYGAVVRVNALAIDLSTSELLPWNPAPNGWVTGMETAGDVVYVGGEFDEVGGVSRRGVAALDAFTGDVIAAFNAQLNGNVKGLLLAGDTLYIAGSFSSAKGQTRNRFAAVHAETSALSAWNPNAGNGSGEAMAADLAAPTTIYLAGDFTQLGGQLRNRLAAVDAATGALVAGWNPNANNTVYKLDVLDGVVYAGGKFTMIGGVTRNHAAAIDATSGAPTAWNPNASGDLYDIDAFDDRVYLAGAFGSVGGQSRSGMAIVRTNGTLLPWAQDDVNGGAVSVIDAASDGVLLGGIITSDVDGKNVGAVFYPETITTAAPNAPVQPKVTLVGNQARLSWSRAAHGAAPNAFMVEGGSARGRRDLANLNAGNVTEFVSPPLPPGSYWFRVRSANGAGVSAASGDQAFVVGATGCGAPPAPPTDITITRTGNTVGFAWRPPTGSPVLGYLLEAGADKGRNDVANADLGNVTVFQASAPDGGYWVRLRAYNACGIGLPSADTLLVMGAGGALAGSPLELGAAVSGNTVTLLWQPPAYGQSPFMYRLEAGSAPGLANVAAATLGSQTVAVFGGVPAGVYYVRVRAINAFGSGPASNEVVLVVR